MADSKRGFAAMDASKQREIASKGGKVSGGNRASGASSKSSTRGAAGKTEAAKRGGENSYRS